MSSTKPPEPLRPQTSSLAQTLSEQPTKSPATPPQSAPAPQNLGGQVYPVVPSLANTTGALPPLSSPPTAQTAFAQAFAESDAPMLSKSTVATPLARGAALSDMKEGMIQRVRAVPPPSDLTTEPPARPFQTHPIDFPPLDTKQAVFPPLFPSENVAPPVATLAQTLSEQPTKPPVTPLQSVASPSSVSAPQNLGGQARPFLQPLAPLHVPQPIFSAPPKPVLEQKAPPNVEQTPPPSRKDPYREPI